MDTNTRPPRTILTEVVRVLETERTALKRLDRSGIDAAASDKLRLDEELSSLDAASLDREDLAWVRRVRAMALTNQLLLVHARSCVRGVLSLAASDVDAGYQTKTPPPKPMRLNFRG